MPRTFLRQATQISNSASYSDALAAGAGLEAQSHLEGDLNALRSQLSRLLTADGSVRWWDAIPVANGKQRSVGDLNADLDAIEEHKVLRRVTLTVDVAVPGGANHVVLNVAGGQAPGEAAAVATSQDGAVVAQSALSGAGFGVHELVELAGANAIEPKNLVRIRNAATGETIQSSDREVFALLQYESTGADGAAFNDTSGGGRVKLSFVRQTSGFNDLEAVPTADIGGLTINYAYASRLRFGSLPEEAWMGSGGAFVDYSKAIPTIDLDDVVDNQTGAVTQGAKDITWRILDEFKVAFQTQVAVDVFAVVTSAAGDRVEITADLFDVDLVNPADFSLGSRFATDGSEVRVGVAAGVIDTVSSDLALRSAVDLYLDDVHQGTSGWSQTAGIKLSSSAGEWDLYSAVFGEVSLLQGIVQAKRRAKISAVVTVLALAGTDVGGVGGGSNLDGQLPDMSAGDFATDYDVYLNGRLMRPGVTDDYYAGASLADGQLRFVFDVHAGDQITVAPYVR